MFHPLPTPRTAITAALLCALLLCGCGRWRVPAFDPTGRRIFAPGTYTEVQPRPFAGISQPAFVAPPPVGVCTDLPPTLPPTTGPVIPQPVCAPQVAPQILAPQLPIAPVAVGAGRRGAIVMTPTRLIAPVGTEVVLKAGLCGGDGHYVTDQPISWVLSQESVGHLVAVGRGDEPSFVDRLFNNDRRPGPRDASFASGRTTSQRSVLPRATPDGNTQLLSGQNWASVTSLAEGVSRVAAIAPNHPVWDGRRQTAVIEWIDAQWTAPAPAIVQSGGQHTLTTSVTRSTDGTPLVGWIVRYEILDGPPAQFVSYAGDAGVAADATTDSNGQASVTISPTTNAAGSTRVRIQILRPAAADGSVAAIVVGDAYTSVSWSAPGLAASIVGPQQVNAGEPATYHIEVSNPGDLRVTNVVVTHLLSPEMSYLGSSPAGQVFGNRIEWRFPVIDPGMIMGIDVTCRADGGGDAIHAISVNCAEGITAEAQAATRVFVNGLSLRMTGPVTAQVGQQVSFDVAVTNASNQRMTNVLASDELAPGLQHESGVTLIERPLGDLEPGQMVEFAVTLTVAQAGELCHNMRITADSGHYAATRACIVASAPAPQAPLPPQGTPAAGAPSQPNYTLRVDGPDYAQIGQIVNYSIVATNTGNVPLTNVRVTSMMDEQLTHVFAEQGFFPMTGGIYWNIPELPVGHQVTLRVQARCNAAAQRACHRATVACDQLQPQAAESCHGIGTQANRPTTDDDSDDDAATTSKPGHSVLSLSSAGSESLEEMEAKDAVGALEVRLTTIRRSLFVGDATTCLVEIRNARDVADNDVQLTLRLPASVRFEHLLDGPVQRQSISPEDNTVTFAPVRELRAGESVTFRLRLRCPQSGRSDLQAEATSRRQMEATQSATTLQVQ